MVFSLSHTPCTEKLLRTLVVGEQYSRENLIPILEVQDINAIRKGVVGKKDEDFLMLFVTENKSSDSTQYKDHLIEDTLFWEGETKHGHDRIITKEERVLFLMYRNRHHSLFTYKGRLELARFYPRFEEPSKFVFRLIDAECYLSMERPDRYATTRVAQVQQRVGQETYRRGALKLWGERCAVTDVPEKNLLIASHIKPWRESNDQERLDCHNCLILNPTYDRLFDAGLITFNEHTGSILLSKSIQTSTWDKLGIDDSKKLRFVPEKTDEYLHYHQMYVFGFYEASGVLNGLIV
ncbi:MAG: DUF3427 domain-containing protein [Sphaerochaeta sp.]|nr:DUF3427 domain-containing protein [Sphaerochaeta sp.]